MTIRSATALYGAVALMFTLLVVACSTPDSATTTASCAFVVGDGDGGDDAKFHYVVYPGQEFDIDDDGEDLSYFPCNSRNYIVSDGTVRDANGEVIGDRLQPIQATTKSGVPVEIGVTAYWTLNQSESAMRNFYNVCFKFRCASSGDMSGDANNSTPGWNDMLGEDFNPALERAVRLSASQLEDTAWSRNDPEQYRILADNTSARFADEVRATLGYPEDIFCGSGNSRWDNPDKPGEGEFTCTPVRIVVDFVRRGEIRSDDNTEGAVNINRQRLENAEALYGEGAGYWLGLQDIIDKCKEAGSTCILNLGGSTASPAIPVSPGPALGPANPPQ